MRTKAKEQTVKRHFEQLHGRSSSYQHKAHACQNGLLSTEKCLHMKKTAQARSKKHRSVQACEIKMLPADYLPAEKRPGERREAIARAD